eukprot:13211788-Alexandrium_andersonii.AAC.1
MALGPYSREARPPLWRTRSSTNGSYLTGSRTSSRLWPQSMTSTTSVDLSTLALPTSPAI